MKSMMICPILTNTTTTKKKEEEEDKRRTMIIEVRSFTNINIKNKKS